MSKFFKSRNAQSPRGSLPSPLYLIEWAALLTLMFIVAHLAGLREFTSVLNGTIGSTDMDWQTASWLGIGYVLIYLAAVLIVPTLLLAALILKLCQKVALTKDVLNDSRAKIETH